MSRRPLDKSSIAIILGGAFLVGIIGNLFSDYAVKVFADSYPGASTTLLGQTLFLLGSLSVTGLLLWWLISRNVQDVELGAGF